MKDELEGKICNNQLEKVSETFNKVLQISNIWTKIPTGVWVGICTGNSTNNG